MIQESKMVYAKNSDGMTVHIDDVPEVMPANALV